MMLQDVFDYGTFFFTALAEFLQSTPMIWVVGIIAVIIITKMFIKLIKL